MANSQNRAVELEAALRENGFRITPQRLAVVKVLVNSRLHPSAVQIYTTLKADFPTISLATVYKTLATLQQMGQVLELGLNDGSNRYDAGWPLDHSHLVCTNCHTVTDVASLPSTTNALLRQVAETHGYQPANYRLDFFGICPTCQKKEASSGATPETSEITPNPGVNA
jgi:Fur family transcriptional regulator, peroxide stress response regulator